MKLEEMSRTEMIAEAAGKSARIIEDKISNPNGGFWKGLAFYAGIASAVSTLIYSGSQFGAYLATRDSTPTNYNIQIEEGEAEE